MKKITKTLIGLAMALTVSLGTATQKLPFSNGSNTTITANAASVSWHWCSYDIYLSHYEAQMIGWGYTFLPSIVGNSMPSPVKKVIKSNATKIRTTDQGNGVRIRMTRWSPFTINAFLTGIYPR